MLLSDKRVDPSDLLDYSIQSASEYGHTEIVELLLNDKRVDPSNQTNYAIKKAFYHKHHKVFYLLWNDIRVKNSLKKESKFILFAHGG